MLRTRTADRALGILLCLISLCAILDEWGAQSEPLRLVTSALVIAATALMGAQLAFGRRAFILVALLLTAIGALVQPGWRDTVETGLVTAAFIAAFFVALATLRYAAENAPSIRECGRFLSHQPPGRRYVALTIGGALFALPLSYGAIALLGSLAMANARQEPDPEIRFHRGRRMLLAVQRAFVSTLPWSPLSFSIAITTTLIAGTSWSSVVLPCLVTGAILAVTGWALDTIFKPRLSHPPPAPQEPDRDWSSLLPLVILLAILFASVAGLFVLTGIRVPGLVLVVVPVIAAGWIAIQSRHDGGPRAWVRRLGGYVVTDMPGYRGELVLLMMAGYIGTVGGGLVQPLVAASGLDLSAVPGVAILVSLVWIIPLTGQIGMNPILAVSLLVPFLPSAAEMGIDPAALVTAITAGWALSGACSPFTATTLLVGSFAGISAQRVGLVWNGAYVLTCALLLSLWVAILAL